MNPNGRILAIDYGEKRVGIAISDPLRIFAKPLQVLSNSGMAGVIGEIKALVDLHSISKILVGMPYAIDGSLTPKTEETMEFYDRLSLASSVPVIHYDERYSTSEAEAELKRLGYTWQEAAKIKDAMAACLILKEYLSTT